jgi:hypothetical protein
MEEDGIGLAEMNKLLLQKIEKLTLYMIEQEKKFKNLEEKFNNLKVQIISNNNAMKTKKYIFFIFNLLTCCNLLISCKENESEFMQIFIQNSTDSLITVTLFPVADIGGLYPICDGCGGHKETEFTLHPNKEGEYVWNEILYYTKDLDIKPYALISHAFDSIYISFANKESVIIKFSHNNVIGYSENIFSEDSTWDFEIVHDESPTQFRRNPEKLYCYKFLILEDKFLIE